MQTLLRRASLFLVLFGLTLCPVLSGTAQGPAKDKAAPKDKAPGKGKEVLFDKQVNVSLDHIFNGGINRNGDLVGMHHYPSAPREMLVDGKKCKVEFSFQNKGGPEEVTTAQIRLRDPDSKQVVGQKFSTLFPAAWSKEQIERAIREAFHNAREENDIDRDGRWGGECGAGFRIEGYVSPNGKTITTAFPIYKKK